MKRTQTISLASDRRARVPFALVAVVLLTTSIVSVSMIAERSTPEIDVSPDIVHERTTMAAESAIPNAVSDALSEAGQQPVTAAHSNEVGAALASENADSDEIFKRYVKLRIYTKVNSRLENTEQRVSGRHGDAHGQAALPALATDQQTIAEALDKITLEIGGEKTDLDQGEYRVTVDGVQHTVSTNGQQIHQEEQSYTVVGETAVFEMHSQVTDYQEMLDNDIEPLLYSRMYPTFFAKAMYENMMATPTEANTYQQLIHNQELIVYTNEINYDMQQSAFGTTDQSYPSMMNVGYSCLAQILGGQLAVNSFTPMKLSYPAESLCYYTMYAETEQASTTAATDIPPVAAFANNESDWESQDSLYNPIPGSAEAVNSWAIDPANIDSDELSNDERTAVSDRIGERSPGSAQKIEIDPIANEVYIQMFDMDDNHFEKSSGINDSAVDASKVIAESETNDTDKEIAVGASHAEIAEINRLREQLIADIDPIEVTPIQMFASDDIYGEMIYQIEQKSDEYVYGDTIEETPDDYLSQRTNDLTIFGLRNAYLQHIIESLESAEDGRQQTIERFDQELGDESLEESLIRAQAAIEGEADNPERIEEIARDGTRESSRHRADRFALENINRNAYVWWQMGDTQYQASRHTISNEDNVGIPASVAVADNGVPETVSENMLFRFYDGGLPASTDETTSIRYTIPPDDAAEGGGFYPDEIPEENRTDDAYIWNIRAVDVDKNIYRATNGQRIDRSIVGQPRLRFGEIRTYVQLHKIDDEKMNLTEGAKEYADDDVYIMTAVDVPQHSDPPSDVDPDVEELVAPDVRPADEENFEFDIHASPGYLTGLPITRDIEPNVRPPGKGPTHARDTLFAPLSAKILNPLPNPGAPIVIVVPPGVPLWISSVNYWKTDVKAEYARFELQSQTSNGLDVGPENYVRQDMMVELDIGGDSIPVGSVEPISIAATNHFPMVAPGQYPNTFMPPSPQHGSWGTGNNLNLGGNALMGAVPSWTPEKCTAGWPDVGPGVDPKGLDRNCADYGPIGEVLSSGDLLHGSAVIHATITGEPDSEQTAQQVEQLCVEGEPCPDVGARDRDD